MTPDPRHTLGTRAIHGGMLKDARGSSHIPIYHTTTFAFGSTADLLDMVNGWKPGAL